MGEEELRYRFIGDLSSLQSATNKAMQLLDDFGRSMAKATSLTNAASKVTKALVSIPIGKWLANAANQSISYTENLNLFTVATGKAYEESSKFIDSMSEMYGLDPSNLMRYAGNFYQLADAISMPDEAMSQLSLGLTKATTDISSLFNVPVEKVFSDLSSGMQGMSRAVRKYGMDIRAVTLQETALSLGIADSVRTMSEANLQGLRYITMMRQASNAAGDFAKTIESPANQLKIFKEQMAQLGRAIGNLFINQLTVAIQYLNGFVMVLRTVITYIGTLIGFVTQTFAGNTADKADDVADSIGDIGSSASGAAKDLKKFLAPFDEINRLESPDIASGSGGGGADAASSDILNPAIAQAIADMDNKLESIRMKAVQVRDAILEFLGFKVEDGTILSWDASQFEQNLINKFPQWSKTIEATFEHWNDIVEGFKSVWESLGNVVKLVWTKVTEYLGKFVNDDSVSSWIKTLGDQLDRISKWIDNHADGLANLVIAFGGLSIVSRVLPLLASLWKVLQLVGLVGLAVWQVIFGLIAASAGWIIAIGVLIYTLVDLWNTNDEFKSNVIKAWNNLTAVLASLWNTRLKPMFSTLGSMLKSLYAHIIKPVVGRISTIILTLWNDVLAPLLLWFSETFGPNFETLCNNVAEYFDSFSSSVGTAIDGVLEVLQGLIDFLIGTFTGDWERAWQGISEVFSGIWNAIAGVCTTVFNAIISVINGVVAGIYDAVVGLINGITGMVSGLASVIGWDLDLSITAPPPAIPYFETPALATGGVVTAPTMAMIGEGKYNEAVIPLGNSPQMKQFAEDVAAHSNSAEQINLLKEQNNLLKQILSKTGTYLDGRELTNTVTKYQKIDARVLGG